MPKPIVLTLELNEKDVDVLLAALGYEQSRQQSLGMTGRGCAVLVEKIYRKLGIRLGNGRA